MNEVLGILPIVTQPIAYRQGYSAYALGDESENPYAPHTDAFVWWRQGWRAAKEETAVIS